LSAGAIVGGCSVADIAHWRHSLLLFVRSESDVFVVVFADIAAQSWADSGSDCGKIKAITKEINIKM
jgi:hypothetical protein